MSDVGAKIFAERGLYQSLLFRCLFFVHLGRSLKCEGIRFRGVLFGMEERLGQMMPCRMIMMTVVC